MLSQPDGIVDKAGARVEVDPEVGAADGARASPDTKYTIDAREASAVVVGEGNALFVIHNFGTGPTCEVAVRGQGVGVESRPGTRSRSARMRSYLAVVGNGRPTPSGVSILLAWTPP
jgi:hypothetical protein